MRRAVPLFTVEVRRRPRLATTSNPDAQSSETRFPQAGFDRASHRVAAAAFEAKKADPSPTEVASSSKGRILPSLVPDESLRRTLRDAALTTAEFDPPSRAPKRPPARTSKGKDQASKLPPNSRLSSDENAPVAECRKGREARLQLPPREGPKSAGKLTFHRECEISHFRGTMKLSCLILHCRSGASRSGVPPFTRWNAIDRRTRLSHARVPDLTGRGADRAQRPGEAASWWGSQLPATPPSRHRDLAKRQALQERPDQAGVPD